jgi:hypothetical protein
MLQPAHQLCIVGCGTGTPCSTAGLRTCARESPRECAGSVETTSVVCPSCAKRTASEAARLVLPTPPFPETMMYLRSVPADISWKALTPVSAVFNAAAAAVTAGAAPRPRRAGRLAAAAATAGGWAPQALRWRACGCRDRTCVLCRARCGNLGRCATRFRANSRTFQWRTAECSRCWPAAGRRSVKAWQGC